jgi:AraC-like DNA-binding protein
MSVLVQHRWRSRGGEGPQRHGQDQRRDRAEPAPSAVLPPGRARLLRDSSANKSACSVLAARLNSIEPCITMWDADQRPRMPGRVRRSGAPAMSGLAAWQQVVLVAYIEKHIAESISVRALAEFVYLSSHCFRRAFKRSFRMPPHRYLVQRRIERAKALLASSAWSIAEIGLALGFTKTSSFLAAFRNVTGITPTEYRRTQLNLHIQH